MAQFSRTWWGQRFIAALEKIIDSGRLGRGRSYARGGKVKSFEIKDGVISAKVRGSVNPYFGVYKEPLYTTTIEFKSISAANWSAAIAKTLVPIERMRSPPCPEEKRGDRTIFVE